MENRIFFEHLKGQRRSGFTTLTDTSGVCKRSRGLNAGRCLSFPESRTSLWLPVTCTVRLRRQIAKRKGELERVNVLAVQLMSLKSWDDVDIGRSMQQTSTNRVLQLAVY